MTNIFFIVLAYICGSIPFGLILTKLFTNIDITKSGSFNIGANNVRRLAGAKLGFLTLLLDFLKTLIPIYSAFAFNKNSYFILTVGFFGVFGHCFSIFLKGKGGKGVSSAAGVFIFLNPMSLFFSFLTYVTSLFLFRIASLSSILASLSFPCFLYLNNQPLEYIIFGILIFILITYKHKDNLIRLKNGQEPKINQN